MSQENVEIARRAVDRWLRGGATLDAIPVEVYADDVEWDFSAYPQIDGATRGTGVDSLLDTLGEFFSAWQSYRAEAGEFIDAGENVVNVLHRNGWRGRSGRQARPLPGLDLPARFDRQVAHLRNT
jgi:ketosteroid isomerase-like protein